ncbi:hypothetical protein APHAL10511_008086 [Amanita phalloides]|nr:hypothetical protein APHAL10511_008086 [Amanita phalloides]
MPRSDGSREMLHSLRRTALISFYVLAFQIVSSAAFSWVLDAPPQQCSNLSITITGSDGVPPYRILIIPTGPKPSNTEVPSIIDQPFDGPSLNIALNYVANYEFVAVVSDARGFGTGGTSAATQVSGSSDSNCLNLTYPATFFYHVGDDNVLEQCKATRIWWDATTVQGTPSFLGIIPGGQSFALPESGITQLPTQGTGFSWTPSIQGGSTLIIVASDDRGKGTGGSVTFTVHGQSDSSCLNDQSPSSTPGTPAGTYSTSTHVSSSSSSSAVSSSSATPSGGGRTKTATLIGSVVGGVVGGFMLLIAVVLLSYCLRRSRRTRRKQPMIDMLEDDPTMTSGVTRQTLNESRDNVLSQYNPEALIAGPSRNTETGSTNSTIPRLASRPSGLTDVSSASGARAGLLYRVPPEPGNRSLSITSSMSPSDLIRIDYIQHQDAGPVLLPPVTERIVELPPQYSDNIRPARFSNTNSKGSR